MIKESTKKFVIIDGNAIIHRAYHALPPLTTKDGTVVNAVYGFTTTLLKIFEDLKPDYLAVCFDVAGGSFRDEIFEGYKAKRIKADQELYDQIPFIHEVVMAFNIPIFTKEGFEADDIIGTIVEKEKKEKNSNLDIVVVSGDMDLLQLVNDRVKVLTLRKGMSDLVLYDQVAVKERYGFGPEYMVDYKSLRGDASDNIPGVKGIGEKTATELIKKYGGIDKIYELLKKNQKQMARELKPSVLNKLENDKEGAEMSRELATIKRDVPDLDFSLEKSAVKTPNEEKLLQLFQKFEFYSLLKRVKKVRGMEATAPTENKSKIKTTGPVQLKSAGELLKILEGKDKFICREICEGENVFAGRLIGLVFLLDEAKYYLKFEDLSEKEKGNLQKIFNDPKKTLLGHDLKKLCKILVVSNIEIENKLFDIMIASYIINSSDRTYGLSEMVLREFGKELPANSNQGNLFGANPEVVAGECIYIEKLYERYTKLLEKMDNSGLFEQVEMALIPVLTEMELSGVSVDMPILKELSEEVRKNIDRVTKTIWKEAGNEFNISSSVQLRDVLFEKMGLPSEGIKKGKTGLSTAASELEKLRGIHPIIEKIEEHRELEKLRNTYIDVLPTLINTKTGRIHTTFNQAVTTTGRLSSSDPNLQNIPIRTELGRKIRNAFVAERGNILISADYSQIELRIVASLAQDERLMEIFRNGEDVHAATAAAINNVPLEKVTKGMRYAAKEVNFGVLYGMGSYGLAWRAGIPQAEAKDFIEKYFREFAGVKKYIDATLEFAKKEGYVETLFGRRRYIPELKSDNFQLRSAGERMAVNMPIQGTAADLMKMAMVRVYEQVRGNKNVKMILQVHDELVLEVTKGLEKEIGKLVKEQMESIDKLRVPIEAHVSVGKHWGSMEKVV